MADNADGWTKVASTVRHSQAALDKMSWSQRQIYELQVISEWDSNPNAHWSGLGKHVSNHTEGKRLHSKVPSLADLGDGSYGRVEKVYRSGVYLARKYIGFKRGRTTELLREEVRVMERLDHGHIVKVVGTYAREDNTLNILVWPVAVCTLQDFLRDLEELRLGYCSIPMPGLRGKDKPKDANRPEILRRLAALDLEYPTLENSAAEGSSPASPSATSPLHFLRQILGCVAHALTYCHRSNVRHLDLKPTNILICPGRVYLADFGIARDVNDQDHTMTMGFQGSPKWQAPEALDSEDGWSMRSADVFSLGLIFLNVATVLYGAKLQDFENALKNPYNPERRIEQLRQYISQLTGLALATQDYADDKALTFGPRHLLGLVGRMLSMEPTARPRAEAVDVELAALGGIEQLYHSSCCRKTTRFLTQLVMDKRLTSAAEDVRRAQAERDQLAKRVVELEGQKETYEMRVANERTKNSQNQERLQKLLDDERAKTQALEAKVAELERASRKQQYKAGTNKTDARNPQRDALGIGLPRPVTHPAPRTGAGASVKAPGLGATPSNVPASIPTPTMAMRRIPSEPVASWARHIAAGSPLADPIPRPKTDTISAASVAAVPPSPIPTTPTGVNYPLRTVPSGSKLPVLVSKDRRTPSRSNTPSLNPDYSNADSTQTSLGSSIFSLRSRETMATATPLDGSPNLSRSPKVGATGPIFTPDTPTQPPVVQPADTDRAAVAVEAKDVVQVDVLETSSIRGSTHGEPSTQSISVASLGDNPPSPVISHAASSSAFSSPRMARLELASVDSDSLASGPRIPALPTGKSWAAIAGDTEGLAKFVNSAARDAAAAKKAAAAAKTTGKEVGPKDQGIKEQEHQGAVRRPRPQSSFLGGQRDLPGAPTGPRRGRPQSVMIG